MIRRLHMLLALLATALTLGACSDDSAKGLPQLGARLEETSVSGISSGAYMAGQYQVAHSGDVVGAGIIAGGPYGCSESLYADIIPGPGSALLNLTKAINGCMHNSLRAFGVPNPEALAKRAAQLAENGRIDPVNGIKDDRVYLFSGKDDHTVVPPIVAAAREFYLKAGVPEEQITFVSDLPAGHGFVTDDKGNPQCSYSGKPYIIDCDYDQAGAVLSQIYGTLNPRADQATGDYLLFNQRAYTRDLSNHGLSDRGIVYVPKSCSEAAGCRVHVAFHGCGQNRTFVGDVFAHDSGFARWADTNKIVVLFPQAAATPVNPQACWDWWGYTGSDYLTRQGPQIIAVRRMIEALSAPRPPA